jgi:hypothetical protein
MVPFRAVTAAVHSARPTFPRETSYAVQVCNGSLRVERMLDGKIDQREIIVTAKIAIEKDGKKPATLDSFIGGWVKVDYVQKDGLFIATSVVARTKAN